MGGRQSNLRAGGLATLLLFCIPSTCLAQTIGIWSSAGELATVPMSGPAWNEVLAAAISAEPNAASVANQDSNNNAEILAAAIAYARNGQFIYRDKVVSAVDNLVAQGQPTGKTLSWARETGAYAMAADLVGYRTTAFETWLRNMAEFYIGDDGRTLLEMYKRRPNNWGTMAFGTLCAIYRYLGDQRRLLEIRDYWIRSVVGPKPAELSYGDLSWQVDEANLRPINPSGAVKQGVNIDGILPDDMRRGGAFSIPPRLTGYPWEALQGLMTAAWILERADLEIWSVADNALCRAVAILETTYATTFDSRWKASGDDVWMLPFVDRAYGSNFAQNSSDPDRLWRHGKIAGWGYVTLASGNGGGDLPPAKTNLVRTPISGCKIDLS